MKSKAIIYPAKEYEKNNWIIVNEARKYVREYYSEHEVTLLTDNDHLWEYESLKEEFPELIIRVADDIFKCIIKRSQAGTKYIMRHDDGPALLPFNGTSSIINMPENVEIIDVKLMLIVQYRCVDEYNELYAIDCNKSAVDVDYPNSRYDKTYLNISNRTSIFYNHVKREDIVEYIRDYKNEYDLILIPKILRQYYLGNIIANFEDIDKYYSKLDIDKVVIIPYVAEKDICNIEALYGILYDYKDIELEVLCLREEDAIKIRLASSRFSPKVVNGVSGIKDVIKSYRDVSINVIVCEEYINAIGCSDVIAEIVPLKDFEADFVISVVGDNASLYNKIKNVFKISTYFTHDSARKIFISDGEEFINNLTNGSWFRKIIETIKDADGCNIEIKDLNNNITLSMTKVAEDDIVSMSIYYTDGTENELFKNIQNDNIPFMNVLYRTFFNGFSLPQYNTVTYKDMLNNIVVYTAMVKHLYKIMIDTRKICDLKYHEYDCLLEKEVK